MSVTLRLPVNGSGRQQRKAICYRSIILGMRIIMALGLNKIGISLSIGMSKGHGGDTSSARLMSLTYMPRQITRITIRQSIGIQKLRSRTQARHTENWVICTTLGLDAK